MKKSNYFYAVAAAMILGAISTVSYAKTYNCDPLRDQRGQTMAGNQSYAVIVNKDGVILATTYKNGATAHSNYIKMEQYDDTPEWQLYEAGDSVVEITNLRNIKNQPLDVLVDLSVRAQNMYYEGTCR